MKTNSERDARIRFREAIKLDKKCIPAYLYWGDSYRREGRNEDACNVWKTFTEKNPAWAHLAFDRLKEVLFDLGQYGEMEEIYRQVIGRNAKDATVYIDLAGMYEKQGRMDEAIDTCRQAIAAHPDSLKGRYLMARLLHKQGESAEALQQTLAILDKEAAKSMHYTCSNCGHESEELIWRCPRCRQWNTFLNRNQS